MGEDVHLNAGDVKDVVKELVFYALVQYVLVRL